MKRLVIGDPHGCYDELMELCGLAGINNDDEIICVGDMVDRGPQSPEVVTFFMRRGKSLLGNHERKHARHDLGLLARKNFGLNQRKTVWQFRQRDPSLKLATYAEAIAWFKTLPLYIELPEAIIVHAGLVYGISLNRQNEKILTGSGFQPENGPDPRGLFRWCHDYPENAKPVIFGHLGVGPAPWPYPVRENLWPLDTGCASGGYLTAVSLPDFKIHKVKSRQKPKTAHR